MKILHLSTADIEGGAARAAYRLQESLRGQDLDSQMLVHTKASANPRVVKERSPWSRLGPRFGNWPLKLRKENPQRLFFAQAFPDAIAPKVAALNPDLVHLHWICNGFLRIETLPQFQKPLVWTLHDCWPFTGGCNVLGDCDRFTQGCGQCPVLGSDRAGDSSASVFRRKQQSWKRCPIHIISPSEWLAHQARRSVILGDRPITVIPHGLDLTRYKPLNQAFAREIFNLDPAKKILLYGASSGVIHDRNKGGDLLQQALLTLAPQEPFRTGEIPLEIVIFGCDRPSEPLDWGFPIHYLGRLQDDLTLALAYSVADVMVVPSRQEAFGQTASEALACGVPVVAFNATGPRDIVEHRRSGYLAEPYDPQDLAQGIHWVLGDRPRLAALKHQARRRAEEQFSLKLMGQRHQRLYEQILQDWGQVARAF